MLVIVELDMVNDLNYRIMLVFGVGYMTHLVLVDHHSNHPQMNLIDDLILNLDPNYFHAMVYDLDHDKVLYYLLHVQTHKDLELLNRNYLLSVKVFEILNKKKISLNYCYFSFFLLFCYCNLP